MFMSILFLLCVAGYTKSFQKPRDGYNTFTDTSTNLPLLNMIMNPKWTEPYFDITVPDNVTALVGKSAYLSCRVRNLGNKTVSWIRHRDIHILTVATYTYTTDQRFQTTFHRDINEWTMQIKWAQKRDAGMYECQISTQPVKSFAVHLNVVETNANDVEEENPLNREYSDHNQIDTDCYNKAKVFDLNNFDQDSLRKKIATSTKIRKQYKEVPTASILGGPDLYVDKGSTINLTCAIRFSPEPPAFIFWYHQNKVISYDSARGGISVRTQKGEITTSYLLIKNADLADNGKYSCSPSNADVTSIKVHVLNGERPEAMQTGAASTIHGQCAHTQVVIIIIVIIIIIVNSITTTSTTTSTPSTPATANTKTTTTNINCNLLTKSHLFQLARINHRQDDHHHKTTHTSLYELPQQQQQHQQQQQFNPNSYYHSNNSSSKILSLQQLSIKNVFVR